MNLQVLVPPVVGPVTLIETKVFLQLDSAHEDALVADLIGAGTELVEQLTGRALIVRSLRQTITVWPDKGIFVLQSRPLLQLTKIQYRDAAGILSTIDAADYYVDPNRSRVIALSSFTQFSFTHPSEALLFDFDAGYGVDETFVPASLRMALLLVIRDLYEHRGEHGGVLPLRAQALLAPFMEARL